MIEKIVKQTESLVKDFDVYFQETEINEVHLQKNEINFINKVYDSGYGIRVFNGGIGFSSSSNKSKDAIKTTVENAIRSSKITHRVDFEFPKQGRYNKVEVIDKRIRKEESALKYTQEIVQNIPNDILLSFGKIRTYDTSIHIINSEGLDVKREETYFMIELSLIAEKNGKRMEFWPHEFRRRLEDISMEDIEKWIKIAKDQTIAIEPKTEKTTVIFSPSAVLDGLGSVLGSHSTGSSKVNGTTKLSPNEKIGDDKLTIISDGLYPYGLGTSSFDDEGVPQRKTPLIENGIFKGYVYDQFYSIKDGVESTGNGLKQSDVFFMINGKYLAQPSNQISNFFVQGGDISFEEIVRETKNGVLIEQFSWLDPDPVTGKFSSEIRAGYYIRKGEIYEPIKGGLVIGNIFEMLKNIQFISNKPIVCSGHNMFAGVCPYISFENLQVAGS
ncbi:MAG: TldD/PmbA family protein [Candidatus Aenigmatarchaeota archaeon]